jgi:hypothetical protein
VLAPDVVRVADEQVREPVREGPGGGGGGEVEASGRQIKQNR